MRDLLLLDGPEAGDRDCLLVRVERSKSASPDRVTGAVVEGPCRLAHGHSRIRIAGSFKKRVEASSDDRCCGRTTPRLKQVEGRSLLRILDVPLRQGGHHTRRFPSRFGRMPLVQGDLILMISRLARQSVSQPPPRESNDLTGGDRDWVYACPVYWRTDSGWVLQLLQAEILGVYCWWRNGCRVTGLAGVLQDSGDMEERQGCLDCECPWTHEIDERCRLRCQVP